ncbi:MAG: CbiX/SirB N-terminal domain-containing protein [Myxococcales bacterium]|nr:CbiX/SirB N-terminal domain-containing protein [Myxococcales bacterium]MCB9713053.1 CbiX/SirB N-terminal domain-containing protein [Myxococcales bacterium]
MTTSTAVVLVAHGSPDPDWRVPVDALAARLRERFDGPVVVAYLGFLEPDLEAAVEELYAAGHRDLRVLSVFLSPGGKHIKRDVPDAVAGLAARHPDLRLRLQPGALGAEPEVIEALAVAAARALGEDE